MTPPSAPPFLDLGSFVAHLEHSGHLRRVAKPVDKDWELACLARWAMESTPEKDAYAILFEHVRNHSIPVLLNLYPTPDIYASALGTQLTTYWSIGVRLWPISSSPSRSILVQCMSLSIWDLTRASFQFRHRSGPLGEMADPIFLRRVSSPRIQTQAFRTWVSIECRSMMLPTLVFLLPAQCNMVQFT